MLLAEIPYCRGFALWKDQPFEVPARYLSRALPSGHTFAHDPLVEVASATAPDGTWVLVAGLAIDVETGTGQLDHICADLLAALATGETAFLDALDLLSGRFVLIYGTGGRVKVLHDACGLRSVYHTLGPRPIVASHYGLLARAIDAQPSALLEARDAGLVLRYGFPGRATSVDGVVMLIPNCLLDLTTGAVERYFPRDALDRTSDVEDVAERVIADVQRQLPVLLERYPRVVASLSAGGDSRCTLALAHRFAQSLHLFTYRRSDTPAYAMDASVACQIARRFGLSHELIDVPDKPKHRAELAAFANALATNAYLSHARPVAYLYWKRFAAVRTVHLRSNLAEIGRVFYNRDQLHPPLAKPSDLAAVYQRKAGVAAHPLVEDAFADYFEAVQFDSIQDYDQYDMLYWEHRMGAWHSNVVMESDPAFETHVVFNSRRILNALLSLPHEARREGAAFSKAIETCWPELGQFPVNPKDWRALYGEPSVGGAYAPRRVWNRLTHLGRLATRG